MEINDVPSSFSNKGSTISAIIGFVLVVVVIGVIGLSINKNLLGGSNSTKVSKVTLYKESDVVMYKTKAEDEYIKLATDNIELEYGAFIKTVDGEAMVAYEDNSIMTISQQTEVQVTKTDEVVTIKQLIGSTWHRVNKVLSGAGYSVETPSSLASVRGTKFGVDVNSDKNSRVYVIESNVKVDELFTDNGIVKKGSTIELPTGKVVEVKFKQPAPPNNQGQISPIVPTNLEIKDIASDIKEDSWYRKNVEMDNFFDKGDNRDILINEYKNINILDIKLLITSPENKLETKESRVLVNGLTDIDAQVFVNKLNVANNRGVFSIALELVPGINEIVVYAKNPVGKEKTIKLLVNRIVEPTPSAKPIVTNYIRATNTPTPKILRTFTPTPTYTPTITPITTMRLNSVLKSNGTVSNSWTWPSGADVSNGFKILRSETNSNPHYPADGYYKAFGSTTTSDIDTAVTKGKIYYYRICRLNPSHSVCDLESNVVKMSIPL